VLIAELTAQKLKLEDWRQLMRQIRLPATKRKDTDHAGVFAHDRLHQGIIFDFKTSMSQPPTPAVSGNPRLCLSPKNSQSKVIGD
jgi:hypothetical protein